MASVNAFGLNVSISTAKDVQKQIEDLVANSGTRLSLNQMIQDDAVSICIRKVANGVARSIMEGSIVVVDDNFDHVNTDAARKSLRILKNPNDDISGFRLHELLIRDYLSTGLGILRSWKDSGGSDRLDYLRVITGGVGSIKRMRDKKDGDTYNFKVYVNDGEEEKTVNSLELILIRFPGKTTTNSDGITLPLSPLEYIRPSIEFRAMADKHFNTWMANTEITGNLSIMRDGVGPAADREIQVREQQNLYHKLRNFGTRIFDRVKEIKKIDPPSLDEQLRKLHSYHTARIATFFGVDPMELGLEAAKAGVNIQEQHRIFRDDSIVSHRSRYLGELSPAMLRKSNQRFYAISPQISTDLVQMTPWIIPSSQNDQSGVIDNVEFGKMFLGIPGGYAPAPTTPAPNEGKTNEESEEGSELVPQQPPAPDGSNP